MDNDRQRYEWDTNNLKANDKFKIIYQEAKKDHRKIYSPSDDKKELENFRSVIGAGGFVVGEKEMSEGEFALHLFNETGDTRLIFNSGDKEQVRAAKKEFEEHIKKGHRAYAINYKGEVTKKRIYSFDAESEEVYLDEKKTLKESLKSFVKKFSEIKMVPKTYPG